MLINSVKHILFLGCFFLRFSHKEILNVPCWCGRYIHSLYTGLIAETKHDSLTVVFAQVKDTLCLEYPVASVRQVCRPFELFPFGGLYIAGEVIGYHHIQPFWVVGHVAVTHSLVEGQPRLNTLLQTDVRRNEPVLYAVVRTTHVR